MFVWSFFLVVCWFFFMFLWLWIVFFFVVAVQQPLNHLLWRFKILTGKSQYRLSSKFVREHFLQSFLCNHPERQRYWLTKTFLFLTLNEIPSLGPNTIGDCMGLCLPGSPMCWCHVFVKSAQSSQIQKIGEQNRNAPMDVRCSGVIHGICGVLAFLLLSQQTWKNHSTGFVWF